MPLNKKSIYWICQFAGWLLFVLLNSIFIGLQDALTLIEVVVLIISFFTGIITSHLYRNFIIKFNWLKFGFLKLLPRFLLASLLLACFYFIIFFLFTSLLKGDLQFPEAPVLIGNLLNISLVYFIWSLIYFLFNFIENYKQEEIKNLRIEAERTEFELNRLKSQLNPHFMFNSMNSIRALIDENPMKAKNAVTQLSNILRNTLQMGKKKFTTFEDELSLVKDYLDLEKTRYEERLNVKFDIDPASFAYSVPPLMIQTLVENAIKHGISKLTKGGDVLLQTKVNEKGELIIRILNSGQLSENINFGTGFGLMNTKQRLFLLYGSSAKFRIENYDKNTVLAEVLIPKIQKNNLNESIDH
jgi:two-component system, LytTR family, sensor kinase